MGQVSFDGQDGIECQTTAGGVRARYIVDASGLAGARLLDQPRIQPADICTAAQEVREIDDPEGALDFAEKQDTPGHSTEASRRASSRERGPGISLRISGSAPAMACTYLSRACTALNCGWSALVRHSSTIASTLPGIAPEPSSLA